MTTTAATAAPFTITVAAPHETERHTATCGVEACVFARHIAECCTEAGEQVTVTVTATATGGVAARFHSEVWG